MRSTGLRLKLVLRARSSHVLPRFEKAKYRIGAGFGTSRRKLRRESTRFDVRPFLLDGLTSDIDLRLRHSAGGAAQGAELRSLLRTAGCRICQRWCHAIRCF